jgi:hypothetical protein
MFRLRLFQLQDVHRNLATMFLVSQLTLEPSILALWVLIRNVPAELLGELKVLGGLDSL